MRFLTTCPSSLTSPTDRYDIGFPKIYNLLSDPKEQYNLLKYGSKWAEENYWVISVMMKAVVEHKKSLAMEPPIKTGTPNPYVPGK